MKSHHLLLCVVILTCFGVGTMLGQNANDYRSVTSADWSSSSTWERYSGSQWEAAFASPDSAAAAISIENGHTVTVSSNVVVDSVTVLAGGNLVVSSGITLTIAPNNDLRGVNVDTLGSMTVNGTVEVVGRLSGADSSIVFAFGSVYDHARDEGSIPIAVWQNGSTFRLSGVTATTPSNTNQNFYDVEIECPNLGANLNLRMSGNTIGGDIRVLNTSTRRYYLTSPSDYVDPITIYGNIFVNGATFSSNGSSSNAHIIVHTYGNIYVSNSGNFGCSRGSGTSVSWYLYGDSMQVSSSTLQNSTSSPDRIQKFIFSKQGRQYLRWSDITYGGAGVSPITVQVGGGTTLDIGTTHIPAGNSGSFILDSAATLISTHNGPGDEGSIECLADLGGGNSFVNLNATAGSGNVSVTATKGPHPNIYDTSKTLHRYWTLIADGGITEATLTFYYHDVPIAPVSEVRGTEGNYKALRYAGSGTNWFTEAGSTVDTLFDFVTATGLSTISGVWTVGETAPPVTSVPELEATVPASFYVDQNYPNPFNPSTTIVYGLPKEDFVRVRVYSILGQEVATLFEGKQSAGVHEVKFDATRLSSGVYLYRVQAGDADMFKRMILIK